MTPFIGQLMLFGGNFAPRGWAKCEGQLLPIAQYSALFSILGTTYGGDGVTTFALPDLRGRVSVGSGHGPGLSAHALGAKGGAEEVTLTVAQMPSHSHEVVGATGPDDPTGARHVEDRTTQSTVTVDGEILPTGGGQPHQNMQPYLVLTWCIALEGIFPSRS